MRLYLCWLVFALVLAASGPGGAQQRSVTVEAPAGVLTQLVRELAPAFRAQTGISINTVPSGREPGSSEADALLLPNRAVRESLEQQAAFYGEGILVGSRADRARVRGLQDIKKALQWIASARGLYVSSSPSLGLRDLELTLWQEICVNVRSRLTWYTEVSGDEAAVFNQAAQFGAYALIQRATWAAHEDRRGLEILVQGDPLLRTAYVSALLRPQSTEARAWHDWLVSTEGQNAIAEWKLNGIQVFVPVTAAEEASSKPPRT